MGEEHDFFEVLNIHIHDITLRELLLYFSMFVCNT